MTRLWDKGTPLDARVLAYTAGDDYLLDNRLVRYDIQASVAHAEMLAVQGLLSAQDLKAIRDELTAIGAEHALGQWRVSLEQEDCQTAIENMLTARIAAARRLWRMRSMRWPPGTPTCPSRVTRICSRRCRALSRCGRRGLRLKYA